jgi:hypothetical protein
LNDEHGAWLDEVWSIVADFRGPADQKQCVVADLRFLVDAAPQHVLFPKNRFELFEGRHKLAEGEVLSGSATEPGPQ